MSFLFILFLVDIGAALLGLLLVILKLLAQWVIEDVVPMIKKHLPSRK